MKNLFIFLIIALFFSACNLKKVERHHGVHFLDKKQVKLILNKSNKNDVIKILGKPHITSLSSDDTWIYVERLITRGKLIKLGRNVLKTNNVLKLDFNNKPNS